MVVNAEQKEIIANCQWIETLKFVYEESHEDWVLVRAFDTPEFLLSLN